MSEEVRITLVNNLTPNDYIEVSENFYRLEKKCIILNNIIKEVREYIEDKIIDIDTHNVYGEIERLDLEEIKRILDKENN